MTTAAKKAAARSERTTQAKAHEVNESAMLYGTFAEIGAGQEVARHFFMAGKASQTIAKTISAYDMIYSDEIYGKEASGRYVCESRLLKMLTKEYDLLDKRLSKIRGDTTTFFAFADTVATSDLAKRQSHGWMGVRFQTTPHGRPNDIIVHVRMLDRYRLLQQEALGTMGVNLVYAAAKQPMEVSELISTLVENIKDGQVVIDMVRATGPDMEHINNYLLNLELVRRGLAEAVLFSPEQDIISVSDTLYGKPVIIERGSFHPVTNSHLDLMKRGAEYFKTAFPNAKEPLPLFEVTMNQLEVQGRFEEQDFLDRVRALASTGHHVLVSNFQLFFKLKNYLRQYTKEPIAMIVGARLLEKLFNEDYYKDLDGGIMEGLGKFLGRFTRLFVYPFRSGDSCMTTKTYFPPKNVANLYKHFLDLGWVVDMADCEEISEFITSEKIHEMIRSGKKDWIKYVPEQVAHMIQEDLLFGVKPAPKTSAKTSS